MGASKVHDRIVAKGYSQCPGVDFTETFAHTLCPATLCFIIAMVMIEDWELPFVDITSALEEDIYMLFFYLFF